MDNIESIYIPILTELREPIFVGGGVRIVLKDSNLFKRYKIACSTCKQFLSGVIEQDGHSIAALVEGVRFNSIGGAKFVISGHCTQRVRLLDLQKGNRLYSVPAATIEPYPYAPYTLDDTLLDEIAAINASIDELCADKEYVKQEGRIDNVDTGDVHGWINTYAPLAHADDALFLYLQSDACERCRRMSMVLKQRCFARDAELELRDKVEDELRESQKEYYLREELKVINDELYGDAGDYADLEAMINDCRADETVIDKLRSEFRKLTNMQPASPESFVARNYIETVAQLPWNRYTQDNTGIENAKKVLEEDHYGLQQVKQRILEFLTVRKLVGEGGKGNILCLYGPPGVGKTSIAKSIARAMGRNYVRISLGGMHDEAEIRGHRRTYIGSMAGRIIGGIKKADSMNPVFLLDEVDKLSNDYKGDPASALLEVLDPEQNKAFVDNYIEVPFDLSRVLFVTTANNVETIARPLRDRMEMIELTGYTAEEKLQIARRHLLPKQLAEHGMPQDAIVLTDEALALLIDGYTKEAGVRGLEKMIASLCRKVAVSFGDKPITPTTIDADKVRSLLGMARYEHEKRDRVDSVGTVTGLAWTELGGETMDIEAVLMPTPGKLRLTGNLGKVMRESAQTAYDYVKSHAYEWNIPNEVFDKELHIHAIEGAVPKDGPSAGCALCCVIVSALTSRKIRADRALTGEISLTGRVLPIGGLKEKSLGALRDGIHTILVPAANRKDVEELPETIREKVSYLYMTDAKQVIKEMLCDY